MCQRTPSLLVKYSCATGLLHPSTGEIVRILLVQQQRIKGGHHSPNAAYQSVYYCCDGNTAFEQARVPLRDSICISASSHSRFKYLQAHLCFSSARVEGRKASTLETVLKNTSVASVEQAQEPVAETSTGCKQVRTVSYKTQSPQVGVSERSPGAATDYAKL